MAKKRNSFAILAKLSTFIVLKYKVLITLLMCKVTTKKSDYKENTLFLFHKLFQTRKFVWILMLPTYLPMAGWY